MNIVHPSGDSGVPDIKTNYGATIVRRRWLYSFLVYYGFMLLFFLLGCIFVEAPSLYELSLWLAPLALYVFSYRRFDIYLLMFFFSTLPLVTFEILIRLIIVFRPDSDSSLEGYFFIIQICLLGYFIYNSYKLLKVNIQNNFSGYKSVVKNLWIMSLIVCYGLSFLHHVHSPVDGFKVPLAKAMGILFANVLIVYLWYYFAIRRKGTIALLVILFFFPRSFFDGGGINSIHNKILWLGFFIYFCISTYRLYKVNRVERREVPKADSDSVEQISI